VTTKLTFPELERQNATSFEWEVLAAPDKLMAKRNYRVKIKNRLIYFKMRMYECYPSMPEMLGQLAKIEMTTDEDGEELKYVMPNSFQDLHAYLFPSGPLDPTRCKYCGRVDEREVALSQVMLGNSDCLLFGSDRFYACPNCLTRLSHAVEEFLTQYKG